MANSPSLSDALFITRDPGQGIGISTADARYGLGGLAAPSRGTGWGFDTGVFPSSSIIDVSGAPLVTDCDVVPAASGLRSTIKPGNYQLMRAGLGPYLGAVLAATDVTHPTADPSNPRIDYVGLRILEPGVDGTAPPSGSVTASVVPIVHTGQPAAAPTEALAASKVQPTDIIFKAVRIRANAGAPLAGDYIEKRRFLAARGAIRVKSSADTSAGAYDGEYRDNGTLQRWSQPDNVWQTVASPATWESFTPKLYSSAGEVDLGANGSKLGRYIFNGKTCKFRYEFRASRPCNLGYGQIYTTLPPGAVSALKGESHVFCKINTIDGPFIFPGEAYIPPNSTRIEPYFPYSKAEGQLLFYRVAASAGKPNESQPYIANGYADPAILYIAGDIEIQ